MLTRFNLIKLCTLLLMMFPLLVQAAEEAIDKNAIPFKENKSVVMEAGVSMGVILLFLIAAGIAYVYLRKKNIGQLAINENDKQIKNSCQTF